MASCLPTPLEQCCAAQENGCCTSDCITEIIHTGGGGTAVIMQFGADPNSLGIIPDDPTKTTIGAQYTADFETLLALWTWNVQEQVWQ